MRFEILGPLEVADESGRKLGLGGRKQRSVLAILLLHANEVVSQDRLVEELWPGAPPASGATSLQAYVSRLRRVLGEDGRIVRTAGGYLIRVAAGDLDVDRFERLVEEGGAAVMIEDWKLASTKLREALGLWRGPPLSDFAYDSFAQAEIARLEELHLAAVERRVEAELALGREAAVIGDLERLVREHPYREQLRSQLMLALYRTGRQAEALDAYREARSVLVEELGIEPSPGLRELHEAILTQDPSLLRAGASVGRTRPDRMRGGEAAAFRRPEEGPAAWEDSDEASPAAWPGETESRHRGRKVGSRAVMVESQHSRLPEGTVTLLFTDIEGSTRLLREVGELYASVLAEHDRLLRRIWAEHGGVVVDTEGDAFFVAFPEASEAVSAAAAAQAALDSHEWQHGEELRVRMGVHTGVPRLRGNDYWGADVHYAARLCAAAHGRQVLLSASTRELVPDVPVDDLGAHGLKDFAAPRRVYHLRLGGTGADQFPPPKTLSRLRTNLPSLPNRLIGRERELAEMGAMLTGEVRLLTVTGVGGSGKTRIALAFGQDILESFTDGVFLVRLAPVDRPEDVAIAMASALGAPIEQGRDPKTALISYLSRREMLVIVDNMEHLLAAAPLLSELLEAAPNVRMLVTSQAPLRLTSEIVMPLAPLEVPSAEEQDITAMERVPAAELFLSRARAADASFALASGDAPAVAELCRRLDGLPLALELAAARVRIGGPRRLLAGLGRGIDALGSGARDLPARQRGLRAALDYTVSLLEEEPQRLLAGLSVFAGAWEIEQAEAMFGDQLDVWEATASLLDFALIRTRGDGRLAMAEPVRAYARSLLARQGDEHYCCERHAVVLAEGAAVIDDEFFFRTPALTSRTIELADEYGSAIRWSADHDRHLHGRLVGALGIPYYLANRIATIEEDVLNQLPIVECDDSAARLHTAHGMVLSSHDDVEEAFEAFAKAAGCRRRLGDQAREAITRAAQAHLLYQSGIVDDRAGELLTAALALPAVETNPPLRALLEGEIALDHQAHGRTAEADRIVSAILADARLDGSFISMCALNCAADLAMDGNEYSLALQRYAQELRQTRAMPINALNTCSGIARAFAGLGQDAIAIELNAAVEANIEREGSRWAFDTLAPASESELQLLTAARARLGGAATHEAERRGRDRQREELLDLALALADEHAAPPRSSAEREAAEGQTHALRRTTVEATRTR